MKVHMVPAAAIQIPGDRFRTNGIDKKKAAELADSIKRLGLLSPITLESDWNLVAGEHRLYAMRDILKWEEIPAFIREEIDELTHREIELEENVMRNEMTPVERVKAIAEIDRLKKLKDPNWTQAQTAAVIGSTRQADVSVAVQVSKMLQAFPELANEKFKSVSALVNRATAKAKLMTRTADVHKAVRAGSADILEVSDRIWNGDSVDLIKQIPDEQFHAIITDPPFGLDYGDKISGTAGTLTEYVDDEASYHRLLTMAPDLYRILRKDGWLIWFFGMDWYEDCKQAFTAAGFEVDSLPIVWNRSGGKNFTRRPDRFFARAYDVALMCRKGEPNIVRKNEPNVITVKPVENSERETLVERPIELYEELITRLTVKGEWVADFFVGGGGCPAACAKTRRNYFGVELSPDRRAYAITKIQANTPEGWTPGNLPWITADEGDAEYESDLADPSGEPAAAE